MIENDLCYYMYTGQKEKKDKISKTEKYENLVVGCVNNYFTDLISRSRRDLRTEKTDGSKVCDLRYSFDKVYGETVTDLHI